MTAGTAGLADVFGEHRRFLWGLCYRLTGSAADVEQILKDRGFGSADYVLSGLPFSTLPPGVGDKVHVSSVASYKVRRLKEKIWGVVWEN